MVVNGQTRSERWRERKRRGLMTVTIEVAPNHRRALEAMGLIPRGKDTDKEAVTWAVERFLNTVKAVQAIGEAMFPEPLEDEAR